MGFEYATTRPTKNIGLHLIVDRVYNNIYEKLKIDIIQVHFIRRASTKRKHQT